MIVGIGTDIVSVLRMEAALQRRGAARFPASHFAAFDAPRKALGAGLTGGRLLQSRRLFRSLHHRALR